MQNLLSKFDPFLKLFFFLSIVTIAYLNFSLFKKVDLIESNLKNSPINQLVNLQTPTEADKEADAPVQTKPNAKQTAYIPLSASYSTTFTNWEDVNSASAWVDLKDDYAGGATVSFDASIRTESGSGKVFARLFDSTNGIAVLGSELEITKGTSTLVSSGNLAFWAGRNLYRVQIRSLDSSRVYIDGARIKVTY